MKISSIIRLIYKKKVLFLSFIVFKNPTQYQYVQVKFTYDDTRQNYISKVTSFPTVKVPLSIEV